MIVINYGTYPCDHYTREIEKAESHIRNKDVDIGTITGSEHYLLRICAGIRRGELRTDEVEVYCRGDRIELDVKGDWIQPWPDELFESDFYLRFDAKEGP